VWFNIYPSLSLYPSISPTSPNLVSLLPYCPLLPIFPPYPVSVATSPCNSILFILLLSLYIISPISSILISRRSISLHLFIPHPYHSPLPPSLHHFLSCSYHSLLSFIHTYYSTPYLFSPRNAVYTTWWFIFAHPMPAKYRTSNR
jgi:hypothetical protein